ncbi:MAG: methyltransferase domain-containing protein, partial [Pseudomonadota bacterium]
MRAGQKLAKYAGMEESAWAEFWAVGDSEQAVGGKHRDRLAGIWRDFFTALAPPVPLILDIAAGNGAAINVGWKTFSATDAATPLLIATDYSVAAVAGSLNGRNGVLGFASDAARLPIRDQSVSVAISQFGIEYAGLGAFEDAARILAPGGYFLSISHYTGGAIDAECAENARLLRAVDETGVQEAARRALASSYERRRRGDETPIDEAIESRLQTAFSNAA